MPAPAPSTGATDSVQRISLRNREYAHVEDANHGIVLLEMGPKVLTLEAHQRLLKKDRAAPGLEACAPAM